MAVVYVGLDAGSTTCHLVGVDERGMTVFDQCIKTGEAALIKAISEIKGEVHVHFEAGELAAWIHGVLRGRVAEAIASDARMSAWIAKDRQKNDRLDATKLAHLLRMGQTHPVHYSEEEGRIAFKQIVKNYDELTRQGTQLKNKIKARYRTLGLIPRGAAVYSTKGRSAWLCQVTSPILRESLKLMYGVLDQVETARKEAWKLMRQAGRSFPEVEMFNEVPGVGPLGACRFSAYVQTPHRFGNKRKLWRYCGLAVTDRRSDGKSLGHKGLDSCGIGALKDMSYKSWRAALRTTEDNALKRAYHQALVSTNDKTHARLTVQRKIVSILRAIWKSGRRYADSLG